MEIEHDHDGSGDEMNEEIANNEAVQLAIRQMEEEEEMRRTQGIQWEKIEAFGDSVPQDVPLTEKQVLNSAGGYAYKISDIMRVRRFLILGTTGGTYYAKEQELKLENVNELIKMIKDGKAMEVLKEIYDVNKSNRAPKMSPIIFCLALVIRHSDRNVQYRAYQMLPKICRIPTHLFEFISACKNVVENKKMSWGRMGRYNIAKWYLAKSALPLAMAVTKYQQRAGWSHRDVIRLAHPCVERIREEPTLAQLQLQEKQPAGGDEEDKKEVSAKGPTINEHNDILLYCVKGFDALCARYPSLTVVQPPIEKPSVPVKPVKKETASDEASIGRRPKRTKKSKKEKAEAEKTDKLADKKKASKENASKQEEQPKEPKPSKGLIISMRFVDDVPNHLQFLQGVQDLKNCYDDAKAVALIKRFGLVREHVPTTLLGSATVWRALLQDMPMTAMIRNLGKMSSIELLPAENNAETELVCRKLRDVSALKAARVHPLALLMAQAVYKNGRGYRGKLSWPVNDSIVDALNDAFYAAFVNVESTGKRFLLALDVSGSMMVPFGDSCLSCREATAALAMLALKTEPVCEVVAFQDHISPLPLTKTDTLNEALEKVSNLPFSGTDCALPMLWAAQHKKLFDCFVVYTDNETYSGDVHPSRAIQMYREKSGVKNAKLIVVGMTATGFSIADPDDPHMMDVVGFDASTPQLMRDFVVSGFEETPSVDITANEDNADAWSAALDE